MSLLCDHRVSPMQVTCTATQRSFLPAGGCPTPFSSRAALASTLSGSRAMTLRTSMHASSKSFLAVWELFSILAGTWFLVLLLVLML
eukprot:m.441366 g.441366  ORF g.441366 m.441366 type:complete len:87 (-) comp20282_c2_seq6:182-442(-)